MSEDLCLTEAAPKSRVGDAKRTPSVGVVTAQQHLQQQHTHTGNVLIICVTHLPAGAICAGPLNPIQAAPPPDRGRPGPDRPAAEHHRKDPGAALQRLTAAKDTGVYTRRSAGPAAGEKLDQDGMHCCQVLPGLCSVTNRALCSPIPLTDTFVNVFLQSVRCSC